MSFREWSAARLLLFALGLALIVMGALPLATIDEKLQYALPMAGADGQAQKIATLSGRVDDVREQVKDAASGIAMAGVNESISVSAGGDSYDARVLCVDEGWVDVEPASIVSGRGLTDTELRRGEPSALIDAALAFKLFGAELPEDAAIEIGSTDYRVVGTVRTRRSYGVKSQYCAWIPLMSLLSEDESGAALSSLKLDTLVLEAHPTEGAGARTLFESTARSAWQSGGTFISLAKEAMRGTIILRLLALALGFSLWGRLLKRMNDFAGEDVAGYRAALKERYFARTIGRLLWTGAKWIFGYGLLLVAAYGLLRLAFYPLYTFTEWVPDDFTSWTSLSKVFWNLIGEHATLVKTGTWAFRELRFFSGLVRWGCVSLLTSMAIRRRGSGK